MFCIWRLRFLIRPQSQTFILRTFYLPGRKYVSLFSKLIAVFQYIQLISRLKLQNNLFTP